VLPLPRPGAGIEWVICNVPGRGSVCTPYVSRDAPYNERGIIMKSRALMLILLTVFISTCKEDQQPTQPSDTNVAGTTWQLTRIDTVDGNSSSPSQTDTILLRFDSDRYLSGASPGMCGNTYFGVYAVDSNNSIRVDSLASTKMNCLGLYWDYFTLLSNAESLQRQDSQMKLYCSSNHVVLVFRLVQ
jgi:heat shock protein HslJ